MVLERGQAIDDPNRYIGRIHWALGLLMAGTVFWAARHQSQKELFRPLPPEEADR